MGKDSLIKSTTKKTAAKKTTKKKTASKTSTAKAKAATAKKTRTAKAAPKKAKAAPKPKPKKITKPKTKAAAKPKAKKATKRVTVKELLLKSFDPITKIAKPEPAASRKKASPSAPPFVNASDPKETARIRKLLFQSYDMAQIKAACAAPPAAASEAAPPPVIKPEQKAPAPKLPQSPAQARPTPVAEAPTVITDLPTESAADPISKTGKRLIAAACVLILLILMVSHSNSSKYYIKATDNSIELWKGRFSPKDNAFFMVLHGTQFLGDPKAVYTRAEVYPIISNYYLDKANTLLEVPGLPDFEGIKGYLHNAKKFAITKEMRKLVAVRLNNIERMTLIFKADAGITKGTKKSLDAAIEQLTSAQALITNPAQEQEIQQKLSLANNLKQVLKNKESKEGK